MINKELFHERHNITTRTAAEGSPGPLLASLAGLQRGGPGFPPGTFHDGLGPHLNPFQRIFASRHVDSVGFDRTPSCFIGLERTSGGSRRRLTGLWPRTLHYFSPAVRRTLSLLCDTTPSSFDSSLCPQCFSEYIYIYIKKKVHPLNVTRFSLLCSVLTLLPFVIIPGLCFFFFSSSFFLPPCA